MTAKPARERAIDMAWTLTGGGGLSRELYGRIVDDASDPGREARKLVGVILEGIEKDRADVAADCSFCKAVAEDDATVRALRAELAVVRAAGREALAGWTNYYPAPPRSDVAKRLRASLA